MYLTWYWNVIQKCSLFLCVHDSFGSLLPTQWLESQHTIRPGTGLVHFGLHGFLRNVSWPCWWGREAAQNIQFLLEEKSKADYSYFFYSVVNYSWMEMSANHIREVKYCVNCWNVSSQYLLTGSVVCSSCHPEGSRTNGNVPSSYKKPAEREKPR